MTVMTLQNYLTSPLNINIARGSNRLCFYLLINLTHTFTFISISADSDVNSICYVHKQGPEKVSLF